MIDQRRGVGELLELAAIKGVTPLFEKSTRSARYSNCGSTK
jgi:hypothetical protein